MKKVLFIGNSHTFFENLPWLFQAVCKQKSIEADVFMIANPGCDWNWHLNNYCTVPNIRNGRYDFVVMQQKSHPFDGAEVLTEQGLPLFFEVKSTNAKAVFTATWSEQNNPDGQIVIDNAFAQLHELCPGSIVANCGAGWHLLRDEINLYADDGEHQNQKGAYLNACILSKTMFGIDILTLPKKLEFENKLIDIPENEIEILQKAAASV